jgi:hypothetical protein
MAQTPQTLAIYARLSSETIGRNGYVIHGGTMPRPAGHRHRESARVIPAGGAGQ